MVSEAGVQSWGTAPLAWGAVCDSGQLGSELKQDVGPPASVHRTGGLRDVENRFLLSEVP